MKKASESIVSSIAKIIACAALALFACLSGMDVPARAEAREDAGDAIEIHVSDLSEIPDGYDAEGAGVAYVIAIPGA